MDCFIDRIGIQGSGQAAPESALYINSLPQVSMESLDKLADAEQQTYLGAWADIQRRAAKRFELDVVTELATRYHLKQLNQSVDLLKIIDKVADQTAAENKYYGFTARLNFPSNGTAVASLFHCFYFQELKFYSKAEVSDVEFKIFDLQTGEELFTTTKTLAIGWNRIPVNTRFFAWRLFVAVDATNITELVSQEIPDGALHSFGCACNIYSGRCTAEIKGATADIENEVADDDITFGENLFGLSAIFSVQCNFHSLVCNNRDLFDLSFWYLCGKECMIENLNSPRRNFFTTQQRDRVIEQRNELSGSYKNALKSACEGIRLDLADACIECNATIKIVTDLP